MQAINLVVLAEMLMCASVASAASIPAIGVVEAPGVTCPSADAVLSALARVRVRGGAVVGEAGFKLFVDRTAEVAHIDLRDGVGGSVLARDIPMTSADCGHAAEAIALIVERHFRSLEWSLATGGARTAAGAPSASAAPPTSRVPATVPPPLPIPAGATPPSVPRPAPTVSPPTPAPAISPAPIASAPSPPPAPASTETAAPPNVAATATATASRVAQVSPPEDAPPLPRLVLGAGPAFWSRNQTFAVAVDARWRVADASPIVIGAGVLLPPLHASADLGNGGQVHVGAVPVFASVGLAQALGMLAVGAHAGTMWTIERGQSQAIAAPATAWRTIVSLGLGVTAAWPVTDWLRVTGEVDGYRAVVGRSYAVDGVPGTVLDPSPWQAVAVLGAEWVIQP